MAEFCKCGSLVIAGRCSNKSCSFRAQEKTGPGEAPTVKKAGRAAGNAPAKGAKTRRASKCITYNLYDIGENGGDN